MSEDPVTVEQRARHERRLDELIKVSADARRAQKCIEDMLRALGVPPPRDIGPDEAVQVQPDPDNLGYYAGAVEWAAKFRADLNRHYEREVSDDPACSEGVNPMGALDDAIRALTAKQLRREGVVTGWVLFVASSRFDDDGDLAYAYNYSVGPDTDMMRAVGLVELGRDRMRRDITAGDD